MSNTNREEQDDEELQELLAARGFNSNVVRLRAFSQNGYKDRSRDVLTSVDIYDLELQIIPKDKKLRNHLLYDYHDNVVPFLGSDNQVLLIPKDETHMYFDVELLYLPLRMTGKRYHHIPESELALFEEESKQEGVFWLGEIMPNDSPIRAMLEKVSPNMEASTHLFIEDSELNEKSAINNDPHNQESVEVFFKPLRNKSGNCWKIDCPICRPVEKFLEAYHKSNRKSNWVLIGRRLNDPESIRLDGLKGLEPLIKQFKLLSQMIEVNQTIWDSWDKIDGRLEN